MRMSTRSISAAGISLMSDTFVPVPAPGPKRRPLTSTSVRFGPKPRKLIERGTVRAIRHGGVLAGKHHGQVVENVLNAGQVGRGDVACIDAGDRADRGQIRRCDARTGDHDLLEPRVRIFVRRRPARSATRQVGTTAVAAAAASAARIANCNLRLFPMVCPFNKRFNPTGRAPISAVACGRLRRSSIGASVAAGDNDAVVLRRIGMAVIPINHRLKAIFGYHS